MRREREPRVDLSNKGFRPGLCSLQKRREEDRPSSGLTHLRDEAGCRHDEDRRSKYTVVGIFSPVVFG